MCLDAGFAAGEAPAMPASAIVVSFGSLPRTSAGKLM
jgi:hypothetical protein